jgi:hypothetical protein
MPFVELLSYEMSIVSFQVPPNHLLSASVMSAPAALAMSKLFYPETKTSKHRAKDVYNMEKGYFLLIITYSIAFFATPPNEKIVLISISASFKHKSAGKVTTTVYENVNGCCLILNFISFTVSVMYFEFC